MADRTTVDGREEGRIGIACLYVELFERICLELAACHLEGFRQAGDSPPHLFVRRPTACVATVYTTEAALINLSLVCKDWRAAIQSFAWCCQYDLQIGLPPRESQPARRIRETLGRSGGMPICVIVSTTKEWLGGHREAPTHQEVMKVLGQEAHRWRSLDVSGYYAPSLIAAAIHGRVHAPNLAALRLRIADWMESWQDETRVMEFVDALRAPNCHTLSISLRGASSWAGPFVKPLAAFLHALSGLRTLCVANMHAGIQDFVALLQSTRTLERISLNGKLDRADVAQSSSDGSVAFSGGKGVAPVVRLRMAMELIRLILLYVSDLAGVERLELLSNAVLPSELHWDSVWTRRAGSLRALVLHSTKITEDGVLDLLVNLPQLEELDIEDIALQGSCGFCRADVVGLPDEGGAQHLCDGDLHLVFDCPVRGKILEGWATGALSPSLRALYLGAGSWWAPPKLVENMIAARRKDSQQQVVPHLQTLICSPRFCRDHIQGEEADLRLLSLVATQAGHGQSVTAPAAPWKGCRLCCLENPGVLVGLRDVAEEDGCWWAWSACVRRVSGI